MTGSTTQKADQRGSIELRWPARELSPNARVHHMKLARFKKRARIDASWAVRTGLWPGQITAIRGGAGPIPMEVTFYPPDARVRDLDNCIASLKAAFDGIADGLSAVGHKVNDARYVPAFRMAAPDCRPRVEILIGGEG